MGFNSGFKGLTDYNALILRLSKP